LSAAIKNELLNEKNTGLNGLIMLLLMANYKLMDDG